MAGYQRQSAANIQPDLLIDAADLNKEFNQLASAFDAANGHSHSGAPGEGAPIDVSSGTSGTLPISRGGTGATTASTARVNLGLGTAAVQNIGTSGATIPLLNTNNTWSGAQTFVGSSTVSLRATSVSGPIINFRDPDGNLMGYVGKGGGDANGNIILLSSGTNSIVRIIPGSGGSVSLEGPVTFGLYAAQTRVNLGLGSLSTMTPSGTANSSTYLRGDNTWATLPSSGVTSVGMSVPTGFTVSGSPVTSTGTLSLAYASGYQGFTTTLANSISTAVQKSGPEEITGHKTFYGLTMKGSTTSPAIYIPFVNSANTRYGYIGKGSTLNSDIHLVSDFANINLNPAPTGRVIASQIFQSPAVHIMNNGSAGLPSVLFFHSTGSHGFYSSPAALHVSVGETHRFSFTSTGAQTVGTHTATTFSGSGASLTSLNATQLTTGTVPAARLSGSYTITATDCSRSVVAGNGLTGGGALTANATLTLGTPGTLNNSTTNAVTATSHTHAVDFSGAIASMGVGAIGSYAFMTATITAAMNPGATFAGSNMVYSNAGGSGSTNPPGTWRLMGYIQTGADHNRSLWQRIS